MRFLILGYRPYLPMILAALQSTDFLTHNEIDIIVAQPLLKQRSQTVLDKAQAQLPAPKREQFAQSIIRAQAVCQQHFSKIDLAFLADYPNLKVRPYPGLNGLLGLEAYDAMIVASYAQKIPRPIFDQPRYGTLNIHPSLLPNLRGGYPTYIQAFDPTQIRGTTIHLMSDGWDNGDIVAQVQGQSTIPTTNEALLAESAHQVAQLLNQLQAQKFRYTAFSQNLSQVTYCHQTLKRRHRLRYMTSADAFAGYVRANYDRYLFPHTFALYQDQLFIILAVQRLTNHGWPLHELPNKAVFRQEAHYYLKVEQALFQITEAVFQGQYLTSKVPRRYIS